MSPVDWEQRRASAEAGARARRAMKATTRPVSMLIPCTTRQPDEELQPGTKVLAFGGARDGRATITRTRSTVWKLGDGTPVVKVAGLDGGIALTHIEVIP